METAGEGGRLSFLSKIKSFTRLFYLCNSPVPNFLLDSGCGSAVRLFSPPHTHMSCVVETAGEGGRISSLSKIKSFTCCFSTYITPLPPTFCSTLDVGMQRGWKMLGRVEVNIFFWKSRVSFENQSSFKAPLFPTLNSALDMCTRELNSNSGYICEIIAFFIVN